MIFHNHLRQLWQQSYTPVLPNLLGAGSLFFKTTIYCNLLKMSVWRPYILLCLAFEKTFAYSRVNAHVWLSFTFNGSECHVPCSSGSSRICQLVGKTSSVCWDQRFSGLDNPGAFLLTCPSKWAYSRVSMHLPFSFHRAQYSFLLSCQFYESRPANWEPLL